MSAIVMHKSARVELERALIRGEEDHYYAPLCGRSPRGALFTLHWKRVTCKRCLRDRPNTSKGAVEAIPQPK